MLDSDIAELFGVETKTLNQQMKRNIERFPEDFCFQLTEKEVDEILRSQNVTSNGISSKRRYNPYVYTEHGIVALAGVIKNEIAANMSVSIARTFVQMRRFIIENGDILLKLAQLQNRQINFEIETNKRFNELLKLINKADLPKQALFFDGQYFDAFDFISSLIRKAKESIVLIDPYCDERALAFLSSKGSDVNVTICKSAKSKLSVEEINTFKIQYGDVFLIDNDFIHDRFLVLDNNECYSLGASLNYVGKKTFVVTKIEDEIIIHSILERIGVGVLNDLYYR